MAAKFKPRKCGWKPCGAVFTPVTEHQKFHLNKCRSANFYAKHIAFIKRARKIMDAQPGK